jgi:hypothetical protein
MFALAGLLGEGCEQLRASGNSELAGRLESDLVGRIVLDGRWTLQIVEQFATSTGRSSGARAGGPGRSRNAVSIAETGSGN